MAERTRPPLHRGALGGTTATTLLEADRQFGVTVRLTPEYRSNFDAVRNVGIIGNRIYTITEEKITGKRIIDATGHVVAPGFVAVKARGMGAPSSNNEEVGDALNPYDPTIKMGLAAGITSFLASYEPGTGRLVLADRGD